MATRVPRRQAVLLASLLVVLAAILAYQFGWFAGAAPSPAPGARAARAAGSSASLSTEVPDVKIEALEAERPAPVEQGRNLFRDRPEPPPPPPPRPGPATARGSGGVETGGPAPPPPIPLKFIGVVEAGGRSVAVLSDGRDVLYGREGEVVDGKYLIVKINVETIEVSYPDGSGRRLIRMTG